MNAFWRPLAAALLAFSTAAGAEERIVSFDSRVAIQKDGSLDVIEAIRVTIEHVAINHGIYRDFPTRYVVPHGGRMRVGFDLLDSSLDGQPVESDVSGLGNGLRIKLGSADSLAPTGEHLYTIHYRVTRELGFFKDYDELYWNVTGTGWMFPIDHASATITLPTAVSFGQRAAYTGPQGFTGSDAGITDEAPGKIVFETTQPLQPYSGLTIAAAFPKGVVAEPTANQKLGWWFADLLPMIAAGLGVAAILAYLYYAWLHAGRDPRRGTIVPLFSPPDDLSPAAMRYVVEEEVDNRAFAAALVHAGINGNIRLVEEKGFLFLGGDKYIEGVRSPDDGTLDPPEAAAVRRLVGPGERLELDNKNHSSFASAREALADGYKERFDGKAFKRNYGWAAAGLLVWACGLFVTTAAIVYAEDIGFAPYYLLVPVLALGAWWLWRLKDQASAVTGCVAQVAAFLLGATAAGIALSSIPVAFASGRWQPLVLIACGLPLALSSFFWISAPTKEGRAMLDRIAGFKQYLSITERERLDRMQAPADTLILFEHYLPYAIALGVENHWADRFTSQLAAAAAAGQQGFGWYSGSHSPWNDASGFANSVGSALSSSISSASTAPGSSSGSGGGGFSGGGGGGGGGGGW